MCARSAQTLREPLSPRSSERFASKLANVLFRSERAGSQEKIPDNRYRFCGCDEGEIIPRKNIFRNNAAYKCGQQQLKPNMRVLTRNASFGRDVSRWLYYGCRKNWKNFELWIIAEVVAVPREQGQPRTFHANFNRVVGPGAVRLRCGICNRVLVARLLGNAGI